MRGRGVGYDHVHAAIDDHSRLAYVETHPDEKTSTCAQFLTNAAIYFAAHVIARIERVITDNAFAYRPGTGLAMAVARLGAVQNFIKPQSPWTNGKVERLNRRFATEWAYARFYNSETERRAALPGWLHFYNHHRAHSAIGGHPPITRLTNVPGHHS